VIILHDLAEWRRQEKENPAMVQPLPLQDLTAYMQQVQAAAGPHPAGWDVDCEALAAMTLLDEIFLQRRYKLVLFASANEPPTPKQLYDHELTAWFGFQRVFKDLDAVNRRIAVGAGQ
jgi:hypothetical protein